MNRRHFLQRASVAAGAGLAGPALAASQPSTLPAGKAEACILLWLGGGPAQVDTFDPKKLGDPKERVAGSAYPAIDTAVPGVQVSENLPETAKRLDRMTILRGTNHDVIDEHAAAVHFMHTGRPVSGTIRYPSIGSLVAHEKGDPDAEIPPYVLEGYPSVSRGAGFLGAAYGYLYLTDTRKGPEGFAPPPGTTHDQRQRRRELLELVREAAREGASPNDPLRDYDAVMERADRLANGRFRKVFDLATEDAGLRERYGGEFGQRCLLARRLVEEGVRFVEVMHNLNFTNGTGWDTHNDGQVKQHLLIRELDQAYAVLLDDLEERGMLDKTIVTIAGEFGRPSAFDSGGGRGHQGSAFSVVLAGGGMNHRGALGATDEASKEVVDRPVSVADYHATIHHALGIDYTKYLYDGDRPVPIVDRGSAIAELF